MFWTLAAFSFCWRAAQSEAERPSGTYLGVFKYRERARVRGQVNGDGRAPAFACRSSHLFWEYLVQLRAARPPAARDSQPQMLFKILRSCPAALRGARRHRAARRGGLRGGEAAQLVVRTLDAYPFTATDGLETLRGAKAVALPARARMTEVFILQISTPCFC